MSTANLDTYRGRALLDVIEPNSQNVEQGESETFHLVYDLQVDGWAAPDTSQRYTGHRNAAQFQEDIERFPAVPGVSGKKKEI